MKVIDFAKYPLVLYALVTSPLIGIGVLGYIIYMEDKFKKMDRQLRATVLGNTKKEYKKN